MNFPLGTFLLIVVLTLGICLGVSLLIASGLSDDKETPIWKQLWDTFFSKKE